MEGTPRFVRHYAEMAVAMVAGMLVLGPVCHMMMTALGYPDPVNTAPWLAILLMASSMALPMALWMLYRGHDWGRVLEMAASMFVPAAVLITFWGAGIMSGCQAHCTLHALMWPSMLVFMLIRYKAYAGHDHARRAAAEA